MEALGESEVVRVAGKILCCQCGTPIDPNPANLCVACLRTQVDITEGIPKQVTDWRSPHLHYRTTAFSWCRSPSSSAGSASATCSHPSSGFRPRSSPGS